MLHSETGEKILQELTQMQVDLRRDKKFKSGIFGIKFARNTNTE